MIWATKLAEKHMEKYQILKYLAKKCHNDCFTHDYGQKLDKSQKLNHLN